MILVLFLRLSSFEKIVSEPNLSQMSLILVCCIDFFDGVEYFCFEMEAFPNLREATSAKLFASEVSLDESFIFEDKLIVCSFERSVFIVMVGWDMMIDICIILFFCFISDSSFVLADIFLIL